MLASVCRGLISLVFPRQCRICGVRIPETGLLWCPVCEGSGYYGPETRECSFCLLDGLAYAGLYCGAWEAEIKAYKFQREIKLADPIAELLSLQLKPFLDSPPNNRWVVVAVPSGHGSSEGLAGALARYLGVDFVSGAIERIDGPRQRDLPFSDRMKNADRVLVPGVSVRFDGCGVILADDVATTLATLRRSCAIVREQGAFSVIGAVGARTPRQGNDKEPETRQ